MGRPYATKHVVLHAIEDHPKPSRLAALPFRRRGLHSRVALVEVVGLDVLLETPLVAEAFATGTCPAPLLLDGRLERPTARRRTAPLATMHLALVVVEQPLFVEGAVAPSHVALIYNWRPMRLLVLP